MESNFEEALRFLKGNGYLKELDDLGDMPKNKNALDHLKYHEVLRATVLKIMHAGNLDNAAFNACVEIHPTAALSEVTSLRRLSNEKFSEIVRKFPKEVLENKFACERMTDKEFDAAMTLAPHIPRLHLHCYNRMTREQLEYCEKFSEYSMHSQYNVGSRMLQSMLRRLKEMKPVHPELEAINKMVIDCLNDGEMSPLAIYGLCVTQLIEKTAAPVYMKVPKSTDGEDEVLGEIFTYILRRVASRTDTTELDKLVRAAISVQEEKKD